MSKIYISCLFALVVAGLAKGQTSSFEIEQFKLREVGNVSGNAALLNTLDFQNLGESSLYYRHTGGRFKHPMLAEESSYFGFSSERYQTLKDWKLYGKFGVETGKEQNVPHTAQLNPLRINPYIIVDSLSGDWNKQAYAIETKIASPLFADRFGVGLGLKYNVATGARQRDPRPQNTNNTLELEPSVMYQLNGRHVIGLKGVYQSFIEDFSISNINSANVQNLYKLIGLGEYLGSSPIFISSGGLTRRYTGNLFGGAFQYVYTAEDFKLLGETYINTNTENVIDGTTTPQNAGKHHYVQYGVNVAASYQNTCLLHRLAFSWDQKDVDNTEYHQYQDATTRQYVTLFSDVFNTNLVTEALLRYDIAGLKAEDISWKLGFSTRYDGWDNRYATNQSQQTVDRLTYKLDFDKYFVHDGNAGFVVNMGLGYSDAFKSTFHYEEKSYSTNLVAHEILYPTNAFMETDFWTGNVTVQYVFKPMRSSKTQLYVKAGGNYSQPTQENAYYVKNMSRLAGQFAIGVYSF